MKNMNAETFANELFPYVWEYFKVDSRVRPQRTMKPSLYFTKPKSPEPMPSTSSKVPMPSTSSKVPMPSTSSKVPMPSTSSKDPMPSTSSQDPMPSTSSAIPQEEEVFPRLVRAVLGMQICFRSDLQAVFDGIPTLNIENPSFMQFVFNYLEAFEVYKDIFERTLGSCVIYAEFALYTYERKQENCFELVPSHWCKYFEMYLKQGGFELRGGWPSLRQTALLMRETVSVVDETLRDDFSSSYQTVQSLEDIKRLIPGLRESLDKFVAKYRFAFV